MTGGGARHHPSGGWHMQRGEAFAWTHGNILLDTIYMIEKDLAKGLSHKHMLGGASICLNILNHLFPLISCVLPLYSEYTKVLEALFPSGPAPPPKYCGGSKNLYCEYQHQCFDDYRPRWSERLSLRNQVVQTGSGWAWKNYSLSEWQLRAGYLDTAVYYVCDAPPCGALSFKTTVHVVPAIQLVSIPVNSSNIFVDTKPPADLTNYKRPAHLKAWEGVVSSFGSVQITGLPSGHMVISIEPYNKATLSHVITWLGRNQTGWA